MTKNIISKMKLKTLVFFIILLFYECLQQLSGDANQGDADYYYSGSSTISQTHAHNDVVDKRHNTVVAYNTYYASGGKRQLLNAFPLYLQFSWGNYMCTSRYY